MSTGRPACRNGAAATAIAVPATAARRTSRSRTAQPGSSRESDPHMPGVTEHVVLSAGLAQVGVADEPVELRPGDYVSYPGDEPHIFTPLEPGTGAVLLSEHF